MNELIHIFHFTRGTDKAGRPFGGRKLRVHPTLPLHGRMCQKRSHNFQKLHKGRICFLAIHRKGSHNLAIEHDGHTAEANGFCCKIPGACSIEKTRVKTDIGDRHGGPCLDNPACDAFALLVDAKASFLGIQTIGGLCPDLTGFR